MLLAQSLAVKPAKAAKPAKAKKSPKVVGIKTGKGAKADTVPGKGHNRGQVNEALQEIFSDYRKMDEDKKAISKAQRDLRAKAKDEHNVSSANFNHEVKLQKLDSDVRVMFETGAHDLKQMLGIQLSLDLASDHDGDDEDDDADPDAAAARASGGN